uniref:Venom protein n=1 Tax=Hemiscolopendra marginata TaxID=943146 RepID=A0A646QI50_9MYRI
MKIAKEFLILAVLFPIIAHATKAHFYPSNSAQRALLDALFRERNNKRSVQTNYRHLCDIERNLISLNIGDQEFYPPFYTELWCKSTLEAKKNSASSSIQTCETNYHCVQQYGTIYVMKKSNDESCETSSFDPEGCMDGTCWKVEKRENIPNGCECMWPNNELGDK